MTEDTAAKAKAATAGARSPLAGCGILIAALLVMLFLVGFSVLTLFRQSGAIEKFTSGKRQPLPVAGTEANDPRLTELQARLAGFREAISATRPATLELTPDDINLAIAAYEPLKDLRGTFQVIAIRDGLLEIAIDFPLNGKPRLARTGERGILASDPRYLHGTLRAAPALAKHELVLALREINVPGKTVAPEFLDRMSPYRVSERYLADPLLGPLMARLTKATVNDGKLQLAAIPGEVPKDTITHAEVDEAAKRLFTVLGVVASIFLALVAIVVLIGLRAKARRSHNS